MNEAAVQAVFASWLEAQGWTVERSAREADIVARRGDAELRVEAKGVTKDKGTDADTAYGQVLRRMVADTRVLYAVVGPTACMEALKRVPAFVRWRLGIGLYEITDEGTVIEHDRPLALKPKVAASAIKLDDIWTGFLIRPEPTGVVLDSFQPVYGYTGYAIPLIKDGEGWEDLDDFDIPRAAATITWEQILFSNAEDAGHDRLDVADAHSGLLLDITSALWNEDGEVCEDLGLDGGPGRDLLHIYSVDVEDGFDFKDTAGRLIEYVIARFGTGCSFAVYYTDKTPHVQLRPLLLERGFVFIKAKTPDAGGIYVADLGLARPPLRGREDGG